jgi:hypothetical protein
MSAHRCACSHAEWQSHPPTERALLIVPWVLNAFSPSPSTQTPAHNPLGPIPSFMPVCLLPSRATAVTNPHFSAELPILRHFFVPRCHLIGSCRSDSSISPAHGHTQLFSPSFKRPGASPGQQMDGPWLHHPPFVLTPAVAHDSDQDLRRSGPAPSCSLPCLASDLYRRMPRSQQRSTAAASSAPRSTCAAGPRPSGSRQPTVRG